jgi:hypothetical protein
MKRFEGDALRMPLLVASSSTGTIVWMLIRPIEATSELFFYATLSTLSVFAPIWAISIALRKLGPR